MSKSGVYKVTNTVNSKFYIGSSANIERRWTQHRYYGQKDNPKSKSYFYRSIKKYGIDKFVFEIVEECAPDKLTLETLEQYYIDLLLPVLNLMPKAASTRLGGKHSDEIIAFLNSPENREKYSRLRKGIKWVDLFGAERAKEIGDKISASRKASPLGRGFTPWNKGLLILPHVKEALCAGRDQYLEENGSWNKGRPQSEAVLQALAEGRDRYFAEHEAWNKGEPILPHVKEALDAGRTKYIEEHGSWNKGLPCNIEQQKRITELARLANLGQTYSEERRKKAGDARRGKGSSAKGRKRPQDVGDKISAALKSSTIFQQSVKDRTGKIRKDNTSGHHGIMWDKSREQWQVRINKKFCGRFDNIEDAIIKRDQVLKSFDIKSNE